MSQMALGWQHIVLNNDCSSFHLFKLIQMRHHALFEITNLWMNPAGSSLALIQLEKIENVIHSKLYWFVYEGYSTFKLKICIKLLVFFNGSVLTHPVMFGFCSF